MTSLEIISVFFQVSFIFIVCYAIVSDFITLTIPNWVPLALTAGFAVYTALFWQTIPLQQHLLFAFVALIIGFGLFALGWMGAGDVKLISSVVLWAGPLHTVPFVFYMALSGGLFAFILILLKRLAPHRSALYEKIPPLKRIIKFSKRQVIPYGVAIGCSALFTVAPVIG
ncbi:MAG: prepilin peptidase [Pseudomonadota bacterium]